MSEVKDDRRQLFDSAVSFLSDDSVKNAPLTKKIEFLQSKGLTQEEVELALKEAQNPRRQPNLSYKELSGASGAPREDIMYEAVPPPIPRRDWKDYFIMATATAGLFYGVYELTRRYVVPNILPEAKSKLEQDKEEIQSYFDKVDKVLNAIEQEQEKVRNKDDEKLEELEATIYQLRTCLDQTTKSRDKMEDEFKMLKLEMINLQTTIDKYILNNKNVKELEKINTEVNSLKSLISATMAEDASGASTESLGLKSPLAKNLVPGAKDIPSAAEILAKLNMGKKDSDSSIPAWKKAREESVGSAGLSIPEWQKKSLNEVVVPNWQENLETAEMEEENKNNESN
ncbi:Pex14p TDEL_0G02450 [Torulaspora delbrueckii]|uniref:Peroxisomal membrane protein PEX14 n=1 Tax=Torulaspora delbrueckii TaxID=4950 RepID=G8ZYY7_TORDE|nr:hypothetical protein TDEL_0G02450 [Torulaspora delbrueckii]CCE93612.1 hypothetical protein TDEL_0G02450 [Torulaspora delbrueckii]